MRRIGIVCDDYKADKFKAALRLERLIFDSTAMTGKMKGHTLFRVLCTESEYLDTIERIYKLCKILEIAFHRSN